jgi:hypothetical protein
MDDVMAEIDYNDVDCSDCEEVNAYIARNDELDALNEDALFTIDAMNDDLAAIRDVLGIGDEDSIIDSVKSLKNSFYVIRMALGIGEEESIVSAAKHMLATIQKNPFRVEWAHSSPPLKGTGFLR